VGEVVDGEGGFEPVLRALLDVADLHACIEYDRGFGPQRKRGRVERKVSVLNRSSKKAVYKVANP
jgi:hypothetical protein